VKISIIGQGYVGLTLSVAASKVGHTVIGFDTNQKMVSQLMSGITDVPGVKSEVLIKLIEDNKYLPTSNFSDTSNSEIIIIAVPTPLNEDRTPNCNYLIGAAEMIAENFRSNALIINESTSYPGTLRNVLRPIIDKARYARFEYASAPERVDPGNNVWKIENTPRVVSGLSNTATEKTFSFYRTFCENVIQVSSPEVAEASKIFENTFRQINIALVNEFSSIAGKMGFSAYDAIQAAATKPFGFMPFYPSIGVGGHCIPVDPSYLSFIANKYDIKANFIELANTINLSMAEKVAKRIEDYLGGNIENRSIQIVGIAYKSNVPDMRESPVPKLIEALQKLGARVIWHDPIVKIYKDSKSSDLSPNIDLGLIVTPHSDIDFSIWRDAKISVLDLSANSMNYGWPKFL
jgi:UDP-N-acetyl-D-glucosamine dehydrogenase